MIDTDVTCGILIDMPCSDVVSFDIELALVEIADSDNLSLLVAWIYGWTMEEIGKAVNLHRTNVGRRIQKTLTFIEPLL